MKAGLNQSARLGQDLKINPRLYQAMDMLYMPLLDLQLYMKQAFEINPFLELKFVDEELPVDMGNVGSDIEVCCHPVILTNEIIEIIETLAG